MKAYVVYRNPHEPTIIEEVKVEEFDYLGDRFEDYRLFYDGSLGTWFSVEQLPQMQEIASKIVTDVRRPFN